MRNSLFCRLLWQRTSRTFHSNARRSVLKYKGDSNEFLGSNLRDALKKKLAAGVPKEGDAICIYRVPIHMRDVEPKAYSPNMISIGPYHHGEQRLREMETLKWKFFHRLFASCQPNSVKLDPVISAMEELEEAARHCYWGKIQHSSESFVQMMAIDGCFIVELLRELKQHDFRYAPSIGRWMLPTLRRDLIMLENQLPLFVVQKLFELTSNPEESSTLLQDLVLRFFNPLLRTDSSNSALQHKDIEIMGKRHFLDLFRSSILPRCSTQEETNKTRNSSKNTATKGTHGETSQTMRSVIVLTEAGVIIEKGKNCLPLDVRSEGRVLQIPPLFIDDYKGTLFRNMVAFEQCHLECKPDVTSYLFFFDGLINSAEDVQLLHHKEVIQHSLGSNKEVAKLVNSLCKEISRDANQSYLHKVESDANLYISTKYAQFRAKLVYHYFSNWVVGISTVAGIIVLYLTLLQTGCTVSDASSKSDSKPSFLDHIIVSFGDPFLGLFSFTKDETRHSGDDPKGSNIINAISMDWFDVC